MLAGLLSVDKMIGKPIEVGEIWRCIDQDPKERDLGDSNPSE